LYGTLLAEGPDGRPMGGTTTIAFDSSASSFCGSCSSLSWMHTTGSASHRILIVGVSDAYLGPVPVLSVTYGSASKTPLAMIGSQNMGARGRVEMWYLLDPPTGTDLVTVTLTVSSVGVVGGSVSYSNVGSVGPDNSNSGGDSDPIVTISANSGDLVVDTLVLFGGRAATANPPQRQRWNIYSSGVMTGGGAGSDQPASSTVTMSWSPSPDGWALIAVDLQPVAPAAQPVGGEMLSLNFVQVLAPWVAAALTLTVAAVGMTLLVRRKNQKR
jgi:hypothetical protein